MSESTKTQNKKVYSFEYPLSAFIAVTGALVAIIGYGADAYVSDVNQSIKSLEHDVGFNSLDIAGIKEIDKTTRKSIAHQDQECKDFREWSTQVMSINTQNVATLIAETKNNRLSIGECQRLINP